jgi:phosphate transport system protein
VERHVFSEGLDGLREQIGRMGGLALDRLAAAAEAALERRPELAPPILEGDTEINAIQQDLDERCLRLLAQQQPVAGDLRLITSVMKVAGDLERVGDQAVNIAGIAIALADHPPIPSIPELAQMVVCASRMLREAVDAYLQRDTEVARHVLTQDDEVDALRDQVVRLVVRHMMAQPQTIEAGLGLILISRNLERIADHATNIAEDVVFLVEARDVRHLQDLP